jgi:hypothetical protein
MLPGPARLLPTYIMDPPLLDPQAEIPVVNDKLDLLSINCICKNISVEVVPTQISHVHATTNTVKVLSHDYVLLQRGVAVLMHTCKRELSPAHLVCPRRHNV